MGILNSPQETGSPLVSPPKPEMGPKLDLRAETPFSDAFLNDKSDDDDEGSISPLSIHAPAWSGTRWTRFFPELSSHFSLASPTSEVSQKAPFSFQESDTVNHVRHRHEASDSTGRISSSTLSDARRRSSCYTRRTSVTSVDSEPEQSHSKSTESFSITSPVAAGVFDDDHDSTLRPTLSSSKSRRHSMLEVREKPLPPVPEPPMQLAPLSVRSKTPHRRNRRTYDDYVSLLTGSHSQGQTAPHNTTLSQAAEDLENTLACLTTERERQQYPQKFVYILDGPLQISRGNMNMVASRPAPRPPVDLRQEKSVRKVTSSENVKRPKKPTLGKSHFFSVRGFGRKQNQHLRSTSSPVVTEPLPAQDQTASRTTPPEDKEADEDKEDILVLPDPSTAHTLLRPQSVAHTTSLRLQLPRLNTKDFKDARHNDYFSLDQVIGDIKSEGNNQNPEGRNLTVHSARPPSPEEKIFVSSSKSFPSFCDMDIPFGPKVIYELDGSAPPAAAPKTHRKTTSKDKFASHHVLSTTLNGAMPDNVVLSILKHIPCLTDLFNLAITSKQFYRIFKQHELDLLRNAVFTMSPAAWELREMSPPWDSEWQILVDPDAPVPEYTPSLYLQRFAQDIFVLAQLKSLLLARCTSFLRSETVQGLTGADDRRASAVDDAFWRIWTFCRIFGCGKGREGDVDGQLDWLRGGVKARNQHISATFSFAEPFGINSVLFEPPAGFGQGNTGGLSHDQMYDMTEIWNCLGVLVQPIHGKCDEARAAGIFNGHELSEDPAKVEARLEEWTFFVLTLGPSAVLNLGSICPVKDATEIFERAKTMGLTKWECPESGSSRSSFLKDAVSKAYNLQTRHMSSDSSSARSSTSSAPHDDSSRTSADSYPDNPDKSHRERQKAYANQLRNRRARTPDLVGASFVEERPISRYATIMDRLERLPQQPPPPPPPGSTNIHYTHQALAPHVHSQFQRQSSPPTSFPQFPTQPHIFPQLMVPRDQVQVRDPVDNAIETMVRDFGFQEDDVKWALKITDTGEGINANAALSLLLEEREKDSTRNKGFMSLRKKSQVASSSRNSLLSSVISSPESLNSGWRWA